MTSHARAGWGAAAAGLLLAAAGPARAQANDADGANHAGKQAGFALVVGVNRGVDSDSVPLRYADDDAVRFQTLFRTVGMKTYTLARLDDNTARLHPGLAAEVGVPRLPELRKVVARLRADVAQARAAGKTTVFYLAYAGHGKADGSTGYIMLEDARLRGPDLLGEIIDPVAAGATHVLVDACHSYFAVLGRGPGGTRRPLHPSSHIGGIGQRSDIGVLLSTSSARESHEWAGFQAGVFSHEVRSGLYGAADADGDGVVSYLEIAAFVDQANVSVPNELFRPEVFARPPAGGATLLDLRPAMAAHIDVDGPRRGHQYLEDPGGVRWMDFHNAGNVRLLRPVASRLYLRRAAGDREQVVPEGRVVHTAELPEQDAHVTPRGAAHDLFRALFALPFSPESITTYAARERDARGTASGRDPAVRPRERLTALAIGAGGIATAAAGTIVLMAAHTLRGDVSPDASQVDIDATNARIARRNRWGTALLAAGGAALAGSATMWLLQGSPASHVDLALTPDAITAGWRGRF